MADPFEPDVDTLIRFTIDGEHDGQFVRNSFYITPDAYTPTVTLDELMDDLIAWFNTAPNNALQFLTDRYRQKKYILEKMNATFPGPPPRFGTTLASHQRTVPGGPIGGAAGDSMASHNCASIIYRTGVKHSPPGFGRLIFAGSRVGPLAEDANDSLLDGNPLTAATHALVQNFADSLAVQRNLVGAGGNVDYSFCVGSPKYHIDSGLPPGTKPPVVIGATASLYVKSQVSRKRPTHGA